MFKNCSKCKQEYPITSFRKVSKNKDGRAYTCKSCMGEINRRDWQKHKTKRNQYQKQRYIENKEAITERNNLWTQNNKVKVAKYKRKHYLENLEHNKLLRKIWRNENREVRRATESRRRVLKIFASLTFDTPENHNKIVEIFNGAKNLENLTGIKYSVDHIIPLKNEAVCGLHVPWNLQLLTPSQNSSKKNKFDGTYENESWRTALEE